MRVQSIRAAVEVRNVAGDRLLRAAVKVPFGKVDGVAEIHDLAQEVGPVAEAFENAWHVLSSGVLAPLLIDVRDFANGVGIFDEADLALDFLFQYSGGFG